MIDIRMNGRVVTTSWWLGGWLLVAVCIAGCQSLPSTASQRSSLQGTLQITGSSTVGPLVAAIAERFEQLHPNVRVDVQTGGSSRGIADVRSGLADIGMSSRQLKASESKQAIAWPIAWDGVGFVVHADNPADEVTRQQLVDIFSGHWSSWPAAGDSAAQLIVIDRAAGRSEVDVISQYLQLQPHQFRADLIAGENQQAIKLVIGNRNAITYLSVGAAEFESSLGAPIKLLRLDHVAASSRSVASGEYPLLRPLVLVTQPIPSDIAWQFIQYAQSAAVDDLIREFAYVPIER